MLSPVSDGETVRIRIGITGSSGFIGWHLQCSLHNDETIDIIEANEDTFANSSSLDDFVSKCDVIVHLAGMNRGDDAELFNTNVSLCKRLIEACDTVGQNPHIIFASSTHECRDTAYGRSKRISSEMFMQWERESGGRFTNLVLPNAFGEHGKPFYNSVVATFCYQLAEGDKPEIIEDQVIELIYIQDVTRTILEIANSGLVGEIKPPGTSLRVSSLLGKLKEFSNLYGQGIVPSFEDDFDVGLFNTYRSFLFPNNYPVFLELHQDKRGNLFEAVKTLHGGQCFVSTTHPDVTRGNHYHTRKFERFLVAKGDAIIRLRRLLFKDILEFRVSGDNPCFIDIPVLHTHNITNVGDDDLMTIFWARELFDPTQSDTYLENV
jgi:UDP-2-acetamido-2,6-beta-L-arabino-hexul-4-ose reductase